MRHRSESVLAEWRSKFQEQRRFFRQKSEVYWSTAIADCHDDSKKLCCAVNRLMQPATSSHSLHSAVDLAAHFTTKVDKVRTATSNAPPPVIAIRQSTMLADLAPVSAEEAARLIKSAPNMHCQLDPIPTWILKKSPERFAPLFAALCNSTFIYGLPGSGISEASPGFSPS